ncbi:flavin reductase family protein [Alteribacillus iranensis]|uniref:NADH-FMN oxidoreductase RutF, flavin reductase (DIM6/NTAB) family n=1 Tax=Alteribacillus iranensis TaxID=930128 RepID=A0A1I2EAU1_9BACI|nr:flavin reductase family protein [Alteribacillus iranensis]SFE89793.1 NADH-FMN oxidoreductase RutF, flavin reductase (DIM6/NTAB) family [Alteribacillus iranensis]
MDTRELRNCLGKFATGVTVVTWFGDEGERNGVTVNAFTSVSLDPPLILVSIDRKAKACQGLKGRQFVVNILSGDQEKVAWQFAGRQQPDLDIQWEDSNIGPKLAGALATFECSPWQEYDGGDHVLYVGKVEYFSSKDKEGLVFFKGGFSKTNDGNQLTKKS